MNNNQFKIIIERPYYTDTVQIWFVKFEGDKIFVAKPMQLNFEQVEKSSSKGNPTLEISGYYSQEFLEALKLAVEGKTVILLEGELKATKYHLEDMRKLIFKEFPKC